MDAGNGAHHKFIVISERASKCARFNFFPLHGVQHMSVRQKHHVRTKNKQATSLQTVLAVLIRIATALNAWLELSPLIMIGCHLSSA